jgi:hypothetical protein
MQIPCVYIPGPAPAVSVANSNFRDNCFFSLLEKSVMVMRYRPQRRIIDHSA